MFIQQVTTFNTAECFPTSKLFSTAFLIYYSPVRMFIYRLSLTCTALQQVSIILGNCVFKWQDKGIISEHDPNLNCLSSPAATDVGTKSRVILMLSQLSSLLLKIDLFLLLFYEEVKNKCEIPCEVHIKL